MATKAKESPAELKLRAKKIYTGLNKLYENAHCELHLNNPLQLLVATILAIQCIDKQVNMVTLALFKNTKKLKILSGLRIVYDYIGIYSKTILIL
jgi:endonuclease III